MHPPSTIILLNGISSAGKTSISKVLQQTMNDPYLQVSIDAFEDMLPDRYQEAGAFAWEEIFPKLLVGFHRSIAALAGAGVNLIVDHVMVYREGWASTLADCVTVLEPFAVYFIGVHCSLEEAKRREQARGDRFIGTAERQYPRVHRHKLYDLDVDTTLTSPEVCAEQIRTFVDRRAPTAFARLRQMPRQSIP
ncbi:MAG: chloramphenicol phosphotransferase CPT family protein [Ktedonobacterales bacterium]